MKKILILGDSISIGYRDTVKAAFDGVAEVYYQNENGRFAAYLLRKLCDWKVELGWPDDIDIVHWNAGLWDDLVLADGRVQTQIESYADSVERVMTLLKLLFPRARIVFATSTPVLEDGYAAFSSYYRRYNRDTEAYNEVAVRAVKKHGGEINDLYALLKDAPRSYHSDMTHFNTPAATRLIAGKVVKCIESLLGISASSFSNVDVGIEIKNIGL